MAPSTPPGSDAARPRFRGTGAGASGCRGGASLHIAPRHAGSGGETVPGRNTLRYLAYGSNLWPARLKARIGPFTVAGNARLPDHALSFAKRGADGSGKCTLQACPGAVAWAAVYELPVAARATLDRIEGVGRGYSVRWLDLPGYGRCFVYLGEPGWLDPGLAPFDWYHALVLAGARHHGFPPAYVSRIGTTVAIRDAERARAADHYALLARSA